MSTTASTALPTEEIDDLEYSNKKVKDMEFLRLMDEDGILPSSCKLFWKEKLVCSNTQTFSVNFLSPIDSNRILPEVDNIF